MFNTIYRLRLLVEETHQCYPVHLCALKEKEPTFNDLLRKVERITEKKLDLNDFYLATLDNKVSLYDDQSLHTALKFSSTSADQAKPLEIALCRRIGSNKRPSDDLHLRNNSNQQQPKPPVITKVPTIIHLQTTNSSPPTATILPPPTSSQQPMTAAVAALENVPIIKPTVLRWTPAILPPTTNDNLSSNVSNVRRYNSISQDDQTIDCRKDSGISLDEPHNTHYRKKQRVMSAGHPSRKLPDLSSSLLPAIRNNSITSLHPLEIRRPSTAPPSCSPPNSPFPRPQQQNYVPLTLPAISSITSSTHHLQILHPQLAPIQSLTANKPPAFLYHPHSPPHHTSIPSIHKTVKPLQQTNPNNKRPRSSAASAASAVAATNATSTASANNIFLCEHVTDHGKICGQTFRRSYDLSRHQTIHLENRPFCYCHQCGKKFTRMDALRRHERVQGHSSGLKAAKQHRSMSAATAATLNLPSLPQQRKTSV